ncbi:MAG: hypothetical protein ACD_5C00051G0003 [uncultured bacterium]|nr:MAG: hypothetical protein ACD_5C00051G0003 [uncultured bacterium]
MYWVYLITLTFTVFVPTLVTQGYWTLDVKTSQEIAILFLGSIGFITFLFKEKSLNRMLSEKSLYQRQVTRMSKDLTNSYSYIGETNRKLDILENISLGYPKNSQANSKDSEEAYGSILEAIQIFGKSNEFVLRFIEKSNQNIIKEIKSLPEFSKSFPLIKWEEERHYYEDNDFIYILSPKIVEDIFSCLIIKKKQSSHRIEDREMMKALVSQALFIFMFTRQKREQVSNSDV